jgi:hypothetical protein
MTVAELVELLSPLKQSAKISVLSLDGFDCVEHVAPSVTEFADGSYLL